MTHPPDPAGYSAAGYEQALPPQGDAAPERASWPLLTIVGALAVAVVFLLVRFAVNGDQSTALEPSSDAPVTLAPPKDHKPNQQHRAGGPELLPHARLASGPRWTMQVPRKWTAIDVPNLDEQAAWRTPGGFPGLGDAVSVLHDNSMASLSLHEYVLLQRNLLGVGITTASHIRTHVSHGQAELTYQLLINGNQAQTLQVVVPTATGFATAAFVAPAPMFDHDVKKVQRYLRTLAGR